MTDTSPNTEESISMKAERPSEEQDIDKGVSNRLALPQDGFEWRKYGQKFIKNIRKMRKAERSSEEQDIDRGVSNRLVLPEDGFEWRKYGQKFIKNIRKMRSYFKCQRSDCIAKKKVEWSVAEPSNLRIVYEAEHNHLSPQETKSSTTATTAATNPYDLLTQVLGDHQTSTSSSLRRHDN